MQLLMQGVVEENIVYALILCYIYAVVANLEYSDLWVAGGSWDNW